MSSILPGVQTVLVERLTLDPTLQPRREMDPALIDEYAERMRAGDQFPPLVAFLDATEVLRLSEGWHRYAAAKAAEVEALAVDVRLGDYRAAHLNSLASNKDHGLRRSNADKRRAILAMLADPEWVAWSNERIAAHLGVSPPTVAKYRDDPSLKVLEIASLSDLYDEDALAPSFPPPPEVRLVERNGRQYEMQVGAIGHNPPTHKPTFTDLLAAAGADSDPAIQEARLAETLAVFLARWYENVAALRTLEESVTATSPEQRWKLRRFITHLREFADRLDGLLEANSQMRVIGDH
jgi:hypothetical protein